MIMLIVIISLCLTHTHSHTYTHMFIYVYIIYCIYIYIPEINGKLPHLFIPSKTATLVLGSLVFSGRGAFE